MADEWHVVASPGRSRAARAAEAAPCDAALQCFEQLELSELPRLFDSQDKLGAAAVLAQVKRLLIDVGAPQGVNLKSLYERLRALRRNGAADAGRTKSDMVFENACQSMELNELEAMLRSQPKQFTVRVAQWSPKARLVGLAPGAAPKREKPPRDVAAEAAYEAQLVQYLTVWPSATLGTLGLDNPPPRGVAARVSTAAFVLARTPKVFATCELRGQTVVRLAAKAARARGSRGEEGRRRRTEAQEGASDDGSGAGDDAAFSPPAPSAVPQPPPAQQRVALRVAQPLPLPAEVQPPAAPRGPPPLYAPPSGPSCLPPPGYTRLEAWGGAAAGASVAAAPLVLPPQHSILPPAARAGSYEAAVTPTAQESRLMQALGGVAGGERILAHMRAMDIEASDLLLLAPLAAADADAELQLLGFAEPVTRTRVRAALRAATETG